MVIDAGHGGKDSGAYGYGGYEKNITLSVAQKLGQYIEQQYASEVKVIQTRKADEFLSLMERANIANRYRADLFISIHCNSTPRYSPEGTETYVLGMHRTQDNFEVAKRENSVIFLEPDYKKTYQGFDPTSPQSVIGLTLIQNTYLKNSIEFAKKVEENFLQFRRQSRGVKQAGFFVIREVSMPSVLIEIGFITNSKEGAFLASTAGQQIIAYSIYKAFSKFKSEYDAKNSSERLSNPKLGSSEINQISDVENKENSSNKPPELISSNSSEVQYTIQLLSLSREIPPSDPYFKGLQPISFYKEGKLYKYVYGSTPSADKAKEWLAHLRNLGFSSAFILAVQNGVRLNKTEAFLKNN